MKTKKIVFFNTSSEVDIYLAAHGGREEGVVFVAMNPGTNVYLKEKGFEPHDTRGYFTNDSHMKLLARSKTIVGRLGQETSSALRYPGVERAYSDACVFWMRLAIHHFSWLTEIVLNAADSLDPEALCASSSGGRAVSSLYIEPEEKYTGAVVERIARARNIRFEDISDSGKGSPDRGSVPGDRLRAIFKFILKYLHFQAWEACLAVRAALKRKRIIFFTTRFYQMEKLSLDLKARYPADEIRFFKGPVIPSFAIPNLFIRVFWAGHANLVISGKVWLEEFAGKIEKDPAFFSYRGVAIADMLSQKVRRNIARQIAGLFLWTIELDRALARLKPKAVLSNGTRPDDLILAELCKKQSVPTILISHGSHIPPKNEFELIEWGEHGKALLRAPFSSLALQSPLSEGYLRVFPSEGRLFRTGPLIWGRPVNEKASRGLFDKMFKGRYAFGDINIVLHAGTPKASNRLRLFVYETPDEYLGGLRDLAKAVEVVPKTVLIVKFRPSAQISVGDVRALVPFSEKVILSVEEKFLDVLGMSDLLVSFSSTTIEEALQNRVPVLLYGGGGRYQHIPSYEITSGVPVIKSAVYHIKEAKDLQYAIREICALKGPGAKQGALFAPYIYAESVRQPLGELVRA